MKTITFSVPGLLLLCMLSSCHDDDHPVSAADRLTAKHWQSAKVEVAIVNTNNKITLTDYQAEPCFHDDATVFSKDGTFINDIGTDNCGGLQFTESGTWTLTDDDKILTKITDGSNVKMGKDYDISFPDVNTLVLTWRDTTCCFSVTNTLGDRSDGVYIQTYITTDK